MADYITVKEFIQSFLDVNKNELRKFCFILGAGASKSSGIPTGSELAKKWLQEIKSFARDDYQKWIDEKKIDEDYPERYYGLIFSRRFKADQQSGYDSIAKLLQGVSPQYGYSVLAQLMTKTPHNVVITTNFDSLTEDALLIYTSSKPLVCGHELLTHYFKASAHRPLVGKIHRDMFLDPKNSEEETKKLGDNWKKVLSRIFTDYVPVVIGYGGNDGSLMDFLREIPPMENLFWCLFKNEKPSSEIINVVDRHSGKFVITNGFDSVMFNLQNALEFNLLHDDIINVANKRAADYRKWVEEIQTEKIESGTPEEKEAAEKLYKKTGDDWYSFKLKADAIPFYPDRESVYLDALQKFSESSDLLREYSNYLRKHKGDLGTAIPLLEKALELDIRTLGPENDQVSTDYSYLGLAWSDFGDNDKAIFYFEKAIEIDLKLHAEENYNTSVHYNNLGTAWYRKEDYDKAIFYYEKALQINLKLSDENDPEVATRYNNIGLAWKYKGDLDKAVYYFDKSLQIVLNVFGEDDPQTSLVCNNLGTTFSEKKEFDKAISYFERALAIDLKILGEQNPGTATDYNNLGLAWKDQKDINKSIYYVEKAYKLFLNMYGISNPSTKIALENYNMVLKMKK